MRSVIEARGLTKCFAGLTAVSDVSLSCERGVIHAVIGPNGAGKSTLINLLSGDLKPTSGKILIDGLDVTGSGSSQMSLLGVGRSYQRSNIYPSLTVAENCNIAVQSRFEISMRFWEPSARIPKLRLALSVSWSEWGLNQLCTKKSVSCLMGNSGRLKLP